MLWYAPYITPPPGLGSAYWGFMSLTLFVMREHALYTSNFFNEQGTNKQVDGTRISRTLIKIIFTQVFRQYSSLVSKYNVKLRNMLTDFLMLVSPFLIHQTDYVLPLFMILTISTRPVRPVGRGLLLLLGSWCHLHRPIF